MKQHAVVLMSTYNGQQYLKEQLDSIVHQTFPGIITVLIRDDGSQDHTEEIVLSYPQTNNRRIVFYKGENVGPQRSFLALINMAEDGDFYFFADQDDIWDPDKLEIAIKAMSDCCEPVCYCSNFRHSHMDLTVYEERALIEKPAFTPLQIIFYNKIPGCTMAFNRKLMQFLKQMHLDNVMMHDSMVLAFASACGMVLYDDVPRITHRIHQSNVVGHGHKKIVLHKWISEKWRLLLKKEPYDLSNMAAQFLAVAEDIIHSEYMDDILLLHDFKNSWKNTKKLLHHPDTKGPFLDRTVLSIRSKIFFKLF